MLDVEGDGRERAFGAWLMKAILEKENNKKEWQQPIKARMTGDNQDPKGREELMEGDYPDVIMGMEKNARHANNS